MLPHHLYRPDLCFWSLVFFKFFSLAVFSFLIPFSSPFLPPSLPPPAQLFMTLVPSSLYPSLHLSMPPSFPCSLSPPPSFSYLLISFFLSFSYSPLSSFPPSHLFHSPVCHLPVSPPTLHGCQLYSSAIPLRIRILDSIHYAGVRLAAGAFRSWPLPTLLFMQECYLLTFTDCRCSLASGTGHSVIREVRLDAL